MAPSILSSPLLNLPIIDKLLANRSLPTIERIQLLHAKITLLTNDISSALTPPSSSHSQIGTVTPTPPTEHVPVAESSGVTSLSSPQAGSTPRQSMQRTMAELECRKEVSTLLISLSPAEFIEAESELSIVEMKCKSILKRHKDREKKGLDGEWDDNTLEEVRRLRMEALRLLVCVEEGLGRDGRARRWRELMETLQRDNGMEIK